MASTLGPFAPVAAGANGLTTLFADLSRAIADISRVVSSGLLPNFSKAAESLARTLTPAVTGLLSPVAKLGGAIGQVAKTSLGAVDAVLQFARSIKEMVRLANPVTVAQFDVAFSDMLATIGAGLSPLLQLATEVVRAFGDTLSTFSREVGGAVATIFRPFVEVLKVVYEVFGRIGQGLGRALEAVAPALEELGKAAVEMLRAVQPILDLIVDIGSEAITGFLAAVVPPLAAFARAVTDVVRWVVDGVRELLTVLGIDLPDPTGTRPGGSVGAATRQASTTDVESVIRKARENAFTLGTASSDPTRKSAGHLESLDKKADRIIELFREMPEKIARAILGDGIVDAVEGAVDTLVEAKDAVLDAGRSALTFVGLREEDKPGGAFDDILKRADEFRARVARDGGGGVVRPE